jgi:hypothetical protein
MWGRHDTQYGIQHYSQHQAIQRNDPRCWVLPLLLSYMLSVITLNVVVLSVIMPSVVAPI